MLKCFHPIQTQLLLFLFFLNAFINTLLSRRTTCYSGFFSHHAGSKDQAQELGFINSRFTCRAILPAASTLIILTFIENFILEYHIYNFHFYTPLSHSSSLSSQMHNLFFSYYCSFGFSLPSSSPSSQIQDLFFS